MQKTADVSLVKILCKQTIHKRDREREQWEIILFFQYCCYGSWGQLLTTPSYEAGSAISYNPWWFRALHKRHDIQPKQWCCLWSDNCHLYYEARPIDRCFGYVFPWFGRLHDILVADLGFTAILASIYLFAHYHPSSLNGTQPKPVTCLEVSAIWKCMSKIWGR